MAQICADRVKDTTTTTGTGNVTLSNSAPSGFRTFGSVMANNDTTLYCIRHQAAAEWEVGLGTYVSATPALARTTVLASSNAGAAVNFSAGTKDVFLTAPATAMTFGVLAPAQLTADQNDYAPTGLSLTNNLRLSSDRPYRAITGIAGGHEGRQLGLENTGSHPILLRTEHTGSAAANRMTLGIDLILWPGDEINLAYDATVSRWEPEEQLGAYGLNAWMQSVTFEDEFLGGGTELGEQGSLGWFNTAAGTAVYTTVANGSAGHVGIIELQTGTTSANAHGMQLGQSATNGIARAQDVRHLAFLVAIPTITTVTVRIGFAQDASSATHGTDGYWFEFDAAANANWRVNTRAGGVSGTIADTGVAVTAGNWYLLEVFYNSSSDLQFYINGVQRATFSANIPTTVVGAPSFRVITNTTAARNLRIDWFRMRLNNLGQRWT